MASNTSRFKCADYHVAWICALPDVELSPARLMLDEEHPSPAYSTYWDENTYICGALNGHMVVIASCPPGETGNVNSGKLTSTLFRTFPNITMAVLVGIAGGIPRPNIPEDPLHDIHLGDVVVGWPGDGKPPCYYHDRGKSKVSGFEMVGTMQNPDWRLASALSILVSDYDMGITSFAGPLKRLQKNKKFAYPGYKRDQLFKSSYQHTGVHGVGCEACDQEQLIRRPRRSKDDRGRLIFHRGRIATGNAVIQDGEQRDQIGKRCGGALCIEMEAAGVDVHRKCLVVRGISDYADSHKTKVWQSYAAGNAAAFTRELLCKLQPDSGTKKRKRTDDVPTTMDKKNKLANEKTGDLTESEMNKIQDDLAARIVPPISPDVILSTCKTFATRRKFWNPWPRGANTVYLKLHHWMSIPGSSLFVIQPSRFVDRGDGRRARARAKDFAVEVADFLKSREEYSVIWAFSLSDQPDMPFIDVLKILIYQMLRHVPAQVAITGIQDDATMEQLVEFMDLAVRNLSGCFIIIEMANFDGVVRLLEFFQGAVSIPEASIKVLVVPYECPSDFSWNERTTIATIPRKMARSRKPINNRRGKKASWQSLCPDF